MAKALGAKIVSPSEATANDVPLVWEGKTVGAMRLPQLTGALDRLIDQVEAELGGNLEEASAMADFRLIDPPRVSQKPVWPNRLVLLPLALVGALAAGLFAAFAGGQLRPVFFHAGDLRAKLDLPILGTISAVMGDADTRRRRNDRLRFIVASGGLVLLFAAGMSAMSILVGR